MNDTVLCKTFLGESLGVTVSRAKKKQEIRLLGMFEKVDVLKHVEVPDSGTSGVLTTPMAELGVCWS